jgi:uncharacterized RDD family membrane protein YckC
MLDTVYTIETPEGVGLELKTAGPVVRFYAWAMDLFVRLVVYLVLAASLPYFGDFGLGALLIGLFLIEWLYPVLFEVYGHGQTPGKRAMRLTVLQDDGVPVGWSASLVRNLLRTVDFLPACYGLGLLSMLLNRDFKRLGDLAAGTIVVYEDAAPAAVEMPDSAAVAPAVGLRLAEQRAILNFAQRAPALSPARARELAEMAAPLTGARGEGAIERLYEIANWLQGRR